MSFNKKYLTIKEASFYLGITQSALRSMIYRRQIEHSKLGSRIRFTEKQLENGFIVHKSINQLIEEGE